MLIKIGNALVNKDEIAAIESVFCGSFKGGNWSLEVYLKSGKKIYVDLGENCVSKEDLGNELYRILEQP